MRLRKSTLFLVFVILPLWVAAMVIVSLYDYEWTLYLNENKNETFNKFMSESIFELESFGGGDISFLYVVVVAIAYFLSHSSKNSKLVKIRHSLGFQVLIGLFTSVFFVHSMKWIIGRARPYEVLKNQHDFTNWFEVGPHFISEGWYHGSFPSGHTATVFLFIGLAYYLLHQTELKKRVIGIIVTIFAFSSGIFMLIARSMTAAHWVSDSVFILFLSWTFTHITYYNGLHMNDRNIYTKKTGKQLKVPSYYELRICLFAFLCFLGITIFCFGIRTLFRGEMIWFAFTIPGAIWLGYYGWKKVSNLGFFNKSKFEEEVVIN